MPTLLLCLLALPLAAAVAVALLGAWGHSPEGPPRTAGAIRWLSLLTTLACAALAVVVTVEYASAPRGPDDVKAEFKPRMVPGAPEGEGQDRHSTTWDVLRLGAPGSAGGKAPAIQFYVGIDGLNVWLVLLTCVLLVPSVLVSWHSIQERIPEFYAWLLALECGMVGVFLAFDIVLFYVFFELTLVPLFFLIGIWGGAQRQDAARKFFVYTLAGSLITLLGVLGVVLTLAADGPDKQFTFSIPELVRQADRHSRELDTRAAEARGGVAEARTRLEGSRTRLEEARTRLEGSRTRLPETVVKALVSASDVLGLTQPEGQPWNAVVAAAAAETRPGPGPEEVNAREKELGAREEEFNAREKELTEAKERLNGPEQEQERWRRIQLWLFLAMLCGFAIKVPLVPVHTWLPLAHTEAPTAGSVLLAGVLLKIGAYGLLRLALPLTPDACLRVGVPLIGTLAVIGIVYGAFCALAQHDIKKLIAYSSVSHMGFCMLGLFAVNEVGLLGGLVTMINHGLSTGSLFLLVGMLYDRYHTRKTSEYGGMGKRLHLLAVFFVFVTLTSIGLPGLNGFVGELLVFLGMYDFRGPSADGRLLTAVGLSGVVLGAWYMLTLVMRVFFGPLREPGHEGHPVGDLDGRELAALVPLAVLCVALGVYPKPVLDTSRGDVRVVAGIYERARLRATAHGQVAAPGEGTPAVARRGRETASGGHASPPLAVSRSSLGGSVRTGR
jgi:NADH-quinone oxidoreductase subunit M